MATAYRKKVEIAEAIEFNGTNGDDIDAWLGPDYDVKAVGQPTNQQVTLRADPSANRRTHLYNPLWVIKKAATPILDFMDNTQFSAIYEPV